jgi:hypothetical protein
LAQREGVVVMSLVSPHGGVMSSNTRILLCTSTAISPTNSASAKLSLRHLTNLPCKSDSVAEMTDQTPEHAFSKYRYELLFGAWLLVTGGVFARIRRQPYSTGLKIEQYESIFKGTSLGAVLLGIGMTPTRSTAARRFRTN